MSPQRQAIGIDGCRSRSGTGWIAVRLPDYAAAVFPDLAGALAAFPDAGRTLVDIPIGLTDAPGGRGCERLVRRLLGPRRNSVFTPPCRSAAEMYERSIHLETRERYRLLCAENRRVTGRAFSLQAFHLLPRIVEAGRLAEAGAPMLESHPELCFARLAGAPMRHGKKTAPGRAERLEVLSAGLATVSGDALTALRTGRRPPGAGHDDWLDALVLALRGLSPELAPLPGPPEGPFMAIWS